MKDAAPVRIWIYRKGSGQLSVHPSPVHLTSGERFRIRNLSATAVTARLPSGIAGKGGAVTIRPGAASAVLTVTPQRQAVYFEYDVTAGSQYAEGGSKPGGFVDP